MAVRFGIIGTGRIARRFVPEAAAVSEAGITAVYNPHPGSAERFVQTCREKAGPDMRPAPFASFDDRNDAGQNFWELVDAVYIASPHETHESYIRQALLHDRHVLCEKPMVLSGEAASGLFEIARAKGLVLAEAVKTAYCPGFRKLMETAASGVIGDIRYADACFTKLEDPQNRELTDTLYGGSFPELGSYVLLPAVKLFGADPADVFFECVRGDNGLDLFTRCSLRYTGGLATAVCGLGVKSEGRLVIGGTKGYLLVPAPWWKTGHFEAHFENSEKTIFYEEHFEGDGLRYEIDAFCRAVEDAELRETGSGNGHLQEAAGSLMPEESIAMARIMEQFMRQERNTA
ncbi:MAG: Gfo/Idh/MocA family oxidoreductase [Lachnospiraceae bacterium]|nr:Gfo/Idh/MocA family oxidoreductase [Lachnospiraceae bacterium]